MAHGTDQAVLGLGRPETNVPAPHTTEDNDLDTLAATTAELATITAAAAAAQADADALELADTVQTLAASASNATACNAALGRAVVVPQLTENTTITISNLTAGQSITFFIKQHASSAKTVTFASVLWAGGAAPTISAGANAVDIITVVKFGSTLYGFVAGQALA